MAWRDFLRFFFRLLRDGYLIAAIVVDALYFGLGWLASAIGKLSPPPMRLSGYLTIFIIGLIVAAYRNELRHRADLENERARARGPRGVPVSDLLMDLRTFESLVKPKQVAAGYELKLPRPERVPLFTAEGWEPVYIEDELGNMRRVVIGVSGLIDLVPIQKKIA